MRSFQALKRVRGLLAQFSGADLATCAFVSSPQAGTRPGSREESRARDGSQSAFQALKRGRGLGAEALSEQQLVDE